MKNIKLLFFALLLLILNSCSTQTKKATNPVIYADVPDVSTIRVGNYYYMSSTTMHMSPGVPIMKSKDLINWEIVSYAYDHLVENDKMNLENGQEAYGKGSWASSLRFHDGMFYVSTFSATSGKTHVYRTADLEKGNWEAFAFEPVLHDNSLFFDDDGRVYMLYGGGKIKIIELLPDASDIKPNGVNQVLIDNVNLAFGEDEVGGLPGEGSQLHKINGKYYLFNIGSPKSHWSRSVIISRADKITGPYESRVALQDKHIAQGGLVDTPEGEWFAMLFGDRGAVGRIPYLVPAKWEDGWPVLGVDGKVPDSLNLPANTIGLSGIVASDEFDRKPGELELPLVWQWNHNPDNENWSISENPGHLRITTGRIDTSIFFARNMLTQRTLGPKSSASTCINVSNMKDGDIAGLTAFQNHYGYVGVKISNGQKYIVMAQSSLGKKLKDGKQGISMINTLTGASDILEQIELKSDIVYFKIDCDFNTDKAFFYYSLNGTEWETIGEPLQMIYSFTKHFMGYRFGLFNYATKTPGGSVDFDWFRVIPID